MEKIKTLLEKAKEIKTNSRTRKIISEQEIDVYLAVFSGEISYKQAAKVLYPNSNGSLGYGKFFSRSFVVIREAIEKGKIKII